MINRMEIANVPVSLLNMESACEEVKRLLSTGQGGYVIFRDVHGIVRSADDPKLYGAHQDATLIAPDGMPLVWIAHVLGFKQVGRVYGPDFLLEFCRRNERAGYQHYFYGSTETVGTMLISEMRRSFPALNICGRHAPSAEALKGQLAGEEVERIRATGANVIWIGLGTPKQELWMRDQSPHLPGCVLLGVGAAFDFVAKAKPQAPRWMQRSGLEWSFRLMSEPRRLARRYLVGIPRFLWLLARWGCHGPLLSR
jgi:N-acetylglucosaminyldiphosphoundecaprenol N-acetyl-beta-D-mannosaminyltransferase